MTGKSNALRSPGYSAQNCQHNFRHSSETSSSWPAYNLVESGFLQSKAKLATLTREIPLLTEFTQLIEKKEADQTTTTTTMMKTAAVMTTMVVVMVVVVGTVEGGWRRRMRRQRRCHRAAGHGVMEEGEGDHFQWSMTGLDQDDLRVTYHAGSFAPEGSPIVFLYPRDRGQRALGLVPAKMFYDFSDPQKPVIVIRKARRGRGMCVVLTKSDVSSRDEMLTQLLERNMTNREVVEEEEATRLVVEETSDPSQFSGVLRDLCSQDLCGNPVDTVYFTAREEDVTEDEEELLEEAEEMDAMFDRCFLLFNDRVIIAGLPTRRQWRRHHHMGPMGPMMESRQQRRQQRLQQRLQRRQQRRRQRRQRRHQGREVEQRD